MRAHNSPDPNLATLVQQFLKYLAILGQYIRPKVCVFLRLSLSSIFDIYSAPLSAQHKKIQNKKLLRLLHSMCPSHDDFRPETDINLFFCMLRIC